MSNNIKISFSFIFFYCLFIQYIKCDYKIGVGRADCTGPSADIVFMGYAKSGQKGCGIHLRQYSRAYIIDDGNKRVLFVTVDACMMTHGIRREVLRLLKKRYNDTYNEKNVILSGTHTHGAPGGFIMDLMYSIPNFGFSNETFKALVNGITRSIIRAHENTFDGTISINNGIVLDTNINRSPASYLMNPNEERQQYEYNVDKELVQLKFTRTMDNKTIGAINWYPVHPTSMNNTNCLVTSDNVGYASILLENYMNPDNMLPGNGEFVGAFSSTNLGDVSPNIKGPTCVNTGELCDMVHSTCNGSAQYCIAFGPGNDMYESTEIIATNLFEKAKELLSDPSSSSVNGPINFIHQYVSMPNETVTITLENGTETEVRGCYPAMGYSFAAGTTDGPGEFDFSQGTTTSNPFWNAIRDFLFPPTQEDIDCHSPKPILLAIGRVELPYEWAPKIVSTQILQIGNTYLLAVPGEFTTMSGRRLKNLIKNEILQQNNSTDNIHIILSGLSNVYTNYIATPEEYQLQRYEGASTIYGPYTLPIYLKLYKKLINAMMTNEGLNDDGPTPIDFSNNLISLIPPVLFDTAGWGQQFGDCLLQPPENVQIGDTVTVKFVSGHPRNNPMQERTFLTIEKYINNNWRVIATDANWETKFIWHRTSFLKGGSEAEIQWKVNKNTPSGIYRIGHFGFYKYIFGGIFPYKGYTNNFTVIS